MSDGSESFAMLADDPYLYGAGGRPGRTKNLELRRARQSMRLSQAQFAETIRSVGNAMGVPNGCSKRLVQKWENGEHFGCRADYLRVLQAVTGLPARQLGFRLPADDQGAPIGGNGGDEDRGGDGSAVATVAAVNVAESGDASPMAGMARRLSDAVVAESMDRLSYALNHPSSADLRTAEFVEIATARLFDLEHHCPARLLAGTVDRHLAMVTALLTAARVEKVRHRLMVASGCTVLLAGWLAFDRGDGPAAHEFSSAAIRAAQAAADDGLLAAGLVHQSYAAARSGDPGAAWRLAHDAVLRTPYDRRATAWAASRVALYAAQLGEESAARDGMSHAVELGENLPDPMPGDGTMPWVGHFDRARLLSSTARAAALLGDVSALDYAAQAVDALGPAKVKSRAVVLAESALAAALAGELTLCLDYGSAAIGLASEMDVSLAADALHEIVPLILPHSEARPVRELLPQLAQLPRTADLRPQAERTAASAYVLFPSPGLDS